MSIIELVFNSLIEDRLAVSKGIIAAGVVKVLNLCQQLGLFRKLPIELLLHLPGEGRGDGDYCVRGRGLGASGLACTCDPIPKSVITTLADIHSSSIVLPNAFAFSIPVTDRDVMAVMQQPVTLKGIAFGTGVWCPIWLGSTLVTPWRTPGTR